ncbi:hypothetical protein COLO4_14939 [Corchorus olitorius]|uniref:F-box family protein n=1 Tax=Corchorus olitorius TaxID=93759 RepID=A0A1R3JQ93_9ROSI|nr:hypothetical protein COLO4_14939 [Corchorus olitorius]
MLDFRQGPGHNCNNISHDLIFLIKSDIQSVTLCRWFYEELIYGKLPYCGHQFIWLKEIWWIDGSLERENVNLLFSFVKQCCFLEELYVTIDPKCYNMTRRIRYSSRLITTGHKQLINFRLLKLEGFPNEMEEIVFARRFTPLFLERPDLEIMAKSSDGTNRWRHLVKVPKLETEGKYPYRFTEFENRGNPHHHVHMHI